MTPMYTPTEDKEIEDSNGITRQVAVKGVPMPLSDAVRYGLVSPDEARKLAGGQFRPAETKLDAASTLSVNNADPTASSSGPAPAAPAGSARRTTARRGGAKSEAGDKS
ncbi:MAG TPA: hypothetical protein VJS44_04655 [Pyrinomonadaceae bacterium]|nr:hypothetical protein [Pyrinomonadaceae bacterium]